MKLTKRAAQIAATLAIAGAALGFSTLAATPAHADIHDGVYTMHQRAYTPAVGPTGLNGVPLIVQGDAAYTGAANGTMLSAAVYSVTDTPNGGFVESAGNRIVLRAKGNGYVGEQYFLGAHVADFALTPR